MAGNIEEFEQKKATTKARLDELKAKLEAHKKKLDEQTKEAEALDETVPADKEKKEKLLQDLKTEGDRQRQEIFAQIDEWIAYYKGPDTENQEFIKMLSGVRVDVEKIFAETVIGDLKAQLDALKKRLSSLDTPDENPMEDVEINEVKAKLDKIKHPEVQDIVAALPEAQSGIGGTLGKLTKMMKPLMKMFSGLMIEFKKMMIGINPFAKPAEKQQAMAEIKQMKEDYENKYGPEDLRALLTQVAKKLGYTKFIFREGMQDSAGYERFKEIQKRDPNKPKEQLVKELIEEYVGDKNAEATELKTRDHHITLFAFMKGKKAKVV
ncbi:hypothetical protein KKF03_00410 [Patescibacteria group bacterium]|nr:hypothetical protein [Patescibacteria group bacterium]